MSTTIKRLLGLVFGFRFFCFENDGNAPATESEISIHQVTTEKKKSVVTWCIWDLKEKKNSVVTGYRICRGKKRSLVILGFVLPQATLGSSGKPYSSIWLPGKPYSITPFLTSFWGWMFPLREWHRRRAWKPIFFWICQFYTLHEIKRVLHWIETWLIFM